jgi:vacuolar protein sorting-associated protein 26
MEISIIKRETSGSSQNSYTENETLAKYEIMDGAPVKGESIPIRLFLGAYDLTPTMRDIQRKFSVKYYLNLVLVDEEERRYFKQQEIILWRKADQYKTKLERSNQMQVYESTQLTNILNDDEITKKINNNKKQNSNYKENGDLIDENYGDEENQQEN